MDLYAKFENVIKNSKAKSYQGGDGNLTTRTTSTGGTGGGRRLFRPPLRAIIRNVLPKKITRFMAPKDREEREKTIPKYWSWKDKDGISKPFDQKLCGACWAISAAQLFSDVVAIKRKMSRGPSISETHILMCQGQFQCGGGIPGVALKDLIDRGATTTACVNYDWCNRDNKCNGDSLDHFDTGEDVNLNTLIPSCLGCQQPPQTVYDEKIELDSERGLEKCTELDNSMGEKSLSCTRGGGGRYRYYAKNAFAVFAENDSQLEDARYDVKEHILEVGPCMGAFFILSNFLDAVDFQETGGIYMENFPYKTLDGEPSKLNNDPQVNAKYNMEGGHAVIVVGWGESDIDAINPDTGERWGKVGYWIVKNTWGERWGDDGHFKMAMYPHNQFSQFDMGILGGVDSNGKNVWLGGMHLVEYDRRVYQPVVEVGGGDREYESGGEVISDNKYRGGRVGVRVVKYSSHDVLEIVVIEYDNTGNRVNEYNFIFNTQNNSFEIDQDVDNGDDVTVEVSDSPDGQAKIDIPSLTFSFTYDGSSGEILVDGDVGGGGGGDVGGGGGGDVGGGGGGGGDVGEKKPFNWWIIVIIVVLVILFVGGGWWFYNKKNKQTNPIDSSLTAYF